MNEGIITRCILLINCLLGIAELTVEWSGVDGTAPGSEAGSRDSLQLEGANGVIGTSRYNTFKGEITAVGVIDVLTKYAMKQNPMPTLRSALGGFQDHLLRPLGNLLSPTFLHVI
jgi:hypothetical protein